MIITPRAYTLSVLILTGVSSALAQEKVEIERSVDVSEVPSVAREWLDEAYSKTKQVHWYFEQTSGETSYEAKLKHAGQWHSVEFGEEGKLQDIEIISRWRALPEAVRRAISTYLNTTYTRHRIKKIQRQLTGPPPILQQVVRDGHASKGEVTERYEIEFYGKNEQENGLWEGLFDTEGQFMKKRRIILVSTNNLSY